MRRCVQTFGLYYISAFILSNIRMSFINMYLCQNVFYFAWKTLPIGVGPISSMHGFSARLRRACNTGSVHALTCYHGSHAADTQSQQAASV